MSASAKDEGPPEAGGEARTSVASAPAPVATRWEAGQLIADKYRLERPLARGGMGEVWAARHLFLDEPIAIKFMDASLPDATEARRRFAREARAAARLRSPHVVQILDHGNSGDVPFLVMELLEGEHLGERLQRVGRLSLPEAARIADQIARALHRAHRAGIVHRDLKPANVFLTRVDDEEVVKLLDFGIAKTDRRGLGHPTENGRDPEGLTAAHVLMGSPHYMSPEQGHGARDVDHRADLWSLGVILFRVVTGALPFQGSTTIDILLRVCSAPPPSPSALVPELGPDVDAFFQRALARELHLRFDSARELASAFGALTRRPVESGPQSRSDPPDSPPWTSRPEDATSIIERPLPPTTPIPSAAASRPRAPIPEPSPISRTAVSPTDRPPAPPAPAAAPTPSARAGDLGRLIDLGFSALRSGDRARTRLLWREALELDPENRSLASNLRRLDGLPPIR